MPGLPHQTVVVQQAPNTSGLAIAGLVFSILGWFTCGLLCIPGAFFCFLALFSRGPKGTAIAGLIVGFPGTLFFAVVGLGIIMGVLGIDAEKGEDKPSRGPSEVRPEENSGNEDSEPETNRDSPQDQPDLAEEAAQPEEEPKPKAKPEPDLIVESWGWTVGHGYITVTGQVTNNTGQSLRAVQAVASFYTADKVFVKESSAIVEYNPILPGQTTPFKVLCTNNPAIVSAQIEFAHLFGGTISMMTREDYEAPAPEEVEAQREAQLEQRREWEEAARKAERELKEADEKAERERKTRTWTANTGGFQVTAMYLGYEYKGDGQGDVKLLKDDGSEIEVSFQRLSEDDQDWVKDEMRRERERRKAAATPFGVE